MLMVNFGWVLFRSESFYQFQEYLGNMFGLNGNGFFSGQALMFLQEYAVYWVIGILLCLPAAGWLKKEAGFPAEAVENKLCRGLSCGNGGTVFRLRHLFGAQRLQSVYLFQLLRRKRGEASTEARTNDICRGLFLFRDRLRGLESLVRERALGGERPRGLGITSGRSLRRKQW